MTLRTLDYGNYGIFLTMGNAGFCPSAVAPGSLEVRGVSRGQSRPLIDQRPILSLNEAWV